MAEPTELRKDANLLQRVIRTIQDESKAVTLSTLALIVSVLTLFMMMFAYDNAKDAKIRVEYQEDKIRVLSEKVEFYAATNLALSAKLTALGCEALSEETE